MTRSHWMVPFLCIVFLVAGCKAAEAPKKEAAKPAAKATVKAAKPEKKEAPKAAKPAEPVKKAVEPAAAAPKTEAKRVKTESGLEYEIIKYDGGLGSPNAFVPISAANCRRKVDLLMQGFETQRSRRWFTEDTFMSMLRIRGVECNAPDGHAEAFYVRKIVL